MNLVPLSFLVKRTLKTLENLKIGSLRLTTPEGKIYHFQGKEPGPNATIALADWSVAKNAMLRGDIALGEDYVAGLWESDSIEALFSLFLLNMDTVERDYAHGDAFRRFGFLLYDRIIRRNSKSGSKQNIEAHYDVGNAFYRLWLDESMTSSSALSAGTEDLTVAQHNKYGRILEHIGAAETVLEVGCGWGGFAEQAAGDGRRVTGLTISPSQHAFAAARLESKADIRLQDYRETDGVFDSIVSIEMFEAVGERYWPVYFNTLAARLKRGGTAVVQTITMHDDFFAGYRKRSDFIRHYVFPGGMLPSAKSFRESAGKAGLQVRDMFAFGQDYARTLREWLTRFEARKPDMLSMGYSEAFIRNWRFYLGICAATFATGRTNVMQVELHHA